MKENSVDGFRTRLLAQLQKTTEDFEENSIIRRLRDGKLGLKSYQELLYKLYLQVQSSSPTMEIAAQGLAERDAGVSEYLRRHAKEEKEHYRWIENDLRNTGWDAGFPNNEAISEETLQYVSYNYYSAYTQPYSKLAASGALEMISGSLGLKYGRMLVKELGLDPETQCQFIMVHGELDQGHTEEVVDVLSSSNANAVEQRLCVKAIERAGVYYKAIYDSIL